jgi:xylulose-5-phosphate/fructose-6-phosphate phosphoketolase
MSANPHSNGGLLLRDLDMPDFRDHAVAVDRPGTSPSEATRVLGEFLREIIVRNPDRFRLMGRKGGIVPRRLPAATRGPGS